MSTAYQQSVRIKFCGKKPENPAAKYTEEFRRETVNYIILAGRLVAECCRELELNRKAVDKWVARRFRELSGEPTPPKADKRKLSTQKRIHALQDRERLLKMYESDKPTSEIYEEYDLCHSTLRRWMKGIRETGSTRAADNRAAEENELIELRRANRQLRMKVDVLKQAALILARK